MPVYLDNSADNEIALDMTDTLTIATQGLSTASAAFAKAARRVAAGPATPPSQQTTPPETAQSTARGVSANQPSESFEGALIALKQAEISFEANLQSLKAADEQSKRLLDIFV